MIIKNPKQWIWTIIGGNKIYFIMSLNLLFASMGEKYASCNSTFQ